MRPLRTCCSHDKVTWSDTECEDFQRFHNKLFEVLGVWDNKWVYGMYCVCIRHWITSWRWRSAAGFGGSAWCPWRQRTSLLEGSFGVWNKRTRRENEDRGQRKELNFSTGIVSQNYKETTCICCVSWHYIFPLKEYSVWVCVNERDAFHSVELSNKTTEPPPMPLNHLYKPIYSNEPLPLFFHSTMSLCISPLRTYTHMGSQQGYKISIPKVLLKKENYITLRASITNSRASRAWQDIILISIFKFWQPALKE